MAITAQAKAAGKSKRDYIQEFLSASFGDLIGNFSRTSELVALMDRELSTVTGLPLTQNWYDAGHTLAENREYYRLLDIRSEGDLQRIMMSAVPWLSLRIHQIYTGIPLLPQGISLTCALFIEAAGVECVSPPPVLVYRRRTVYRRRERYSESAFTTNAAVARVLTTVSIVLA